MVLSAPGLRHRPELQTQLVGWPTLAFTEHQVIEADALHLGQPDQGF